MRNSAKNIIGLIFYASSPDIRSNTSVCLTLKLTEEEITEMVEILEIENIAYDINSYRDSPPGLRIWCGATVEEEDLRLLMKWIEWSYKTIYLRKYTDNYYEDP